MSVIEQLDKELIATIRLIRSEGIGLKTFQNIIKLYKSPLKALENLPELIAKSRSNIILATESAAIRELEITNLSGATVISFLDPQYSKLLLRTDSFPPIITIKGNAKLLNKDALAIVGSRFASENGSRLAYKLANDLAKRGLITVSGLAQGIDTSAHKGSLEFGTIAVIAGGINNIYPLQNTKLYHEIAEQGLIITEMPFGAAPTGNSFPQRNRIISGVALGTLVVEAKIKSGSMITASQTLQQNRELFAVPGFPLDPRHKGANQLIKNGAFLTESAEDIIEQLQLSASCNVIRETLKDEEPLDEHEKILYMDIEVDSEKQKIISLLGPSPISVDYLLTITKLPINLLLTIVLELELSGHIIRHAGNQISLKFE